MPSPTDSPPCRSDEDLATLASGGDAHALEELLRRSRPWIHTLAFYMLQDRESAEDATQEVLIRSRSGDRVSTGGKETPNLTSGREGLSLRSNKGVSRWV